MKQFLFCLTISLYGSILAVGQTTGTLTSHKFQSGGIERSYKYYQPANLSSGSPFHIEVLSSVPCISNRGIGRFVSNSRYIHSSVSPATGATAVNISGRLYAKR